jgi:transposase
MTAPTATRLAQCITVPPTLFVAFELGGNPWKLAITTGVAQRPRERRVPARDITMVQHESSRVQQRFGLPAGTHVVSCYEAGRDGFWLHCALGALGVANVGGASSSMEVKRRYRRAKKERLDVYQLLTMLRSSLAGEKQVGSVVHVPRVAEEDRPQLHRALLTAQRDRTRVLNRVQGWLAAQGLTLTRHGDVTKQLEQLRLGDDTAVPPGLRQRLPRAWEPREFWSQRMAQLAAERRARLRTAEEAARTPVRQLLTLTGSGEKSAG